MYEYILFCIPVVYFYYFYFYENNSENNKKNDTIFIVKKTNNLYENWAKKPEIRTILDITKELPNTIIFDNLITIFMLETVYNNILKNINYLTKDPIQNQYLNNNLKNT